MFYAFLLVCASNSDMNVDYSRCIEFQDTFGPYSTVEQCQTRANELIVIPEKPDMNMLFSEALGGPSFFYSEARCIDPGAEV
jgi:hypothetical protein